MNEIFKNSNEPVKMLDFVRHLYKKYKVLNKLTDKQSKDFQAEVVNLLVDPNENVDRQTINDILTNLGIQSFVLQVVGNVINRNPFKNQFELNRNLDTIAENIKKQQEDLQKRQKILQRKQDKLKALQQNLLTTIKQKVQSMQLASINRIVAKEGEVKKSISVLINQLKSKEKLIVDKYDAIKATKNLLKQVDQKQKIINEKLKLLEKRQKQFKGKETEQSNSKKDKEIYQMQQQNIKLREIFKQLTGRHKNLELAYKKMKNDNQKIKKLKSQDQQKDVIINQSSKKKQNIDSLNKELDNLQFSVIQTKAETQKFNIDYLEMKMNEILVKISNGSEKKEVQSIIATILHKTSQLQQQQILDGSDEQEDEDKILFLTNQNDALDPHEKILKLVQSIQLEDSQEKQRLIQSGLIQKLLRQITILRYPYQICIELLQRILPLMEIDSAHQNVVAYFTKTYITEQLQAIYLSHQTSEDITQASTLILSRVKLWTNSLDLNEQFRKAIDIRRRVEPKDSMLSMNINFLL